MATADAQLQAMRQLEENWDGYGAAIPPAHVIELAREFVKLIETVLEKRPAATDMLHVSPTRTGGVLVEWEDAELQHEVEINPDQSFAFLHYNETGVSVTRLQIITPERLLALVRGSAEAGSRVASARTGGVRAMGLKAVPRPLPDDPGHAEIQSDTASLDDHACRKRLAMLFQFLP